MEDFYEIVIKEIDKAAKANTELFKSYIHNVATDAYLKGYRRGIKNIRDTYSRLSKYDDYELYKIFFYDDNPMLMYAKPDTIINNFDLIAINSILDKYEAENKKE